MSRTPTLAEVLKAALEARIAEIHVSLPAKIVRYDASKQLIDAQPLVKGRYVDENDVEQAYSLPVITNVPVCFPSGGGFRITFPLKVGDTVCLLFSERSLDTWLSQGGEVDELDYRDHSLNDAQAFLGLRPFNAPLKSAPTDRMAMGNDGGVTIEITGSEIRLGGAATGVVKFADMKIAYDTHTHISAAPGMPTSPPAVPMPGSAESGVTKTG
jgi:hypothetical protein